MILSWFGIIKCKDYASIGCNHGYYVGGAHNPVNLWQIKQEFNKNKYTALDGNETERKKKFINMLKIWVKKAEAERCNGQHHMSSSNKPNASDGLYDVDVMNNLNIEFDENDVIKSITELKPTAFYKCNEPGGCTVDDELTGKFFIRWGTSSPRFVVRAADERHDGYGESVWCRKYEHRGLFEINWSSDAKLYNKASNGHEIGNLFSVIDEKESALMSSTFQQHFDENSYSNSYIPWNSTSKKERFACYNVPEYVFLKITLQIICNTSNDKKFVNQLVRWIKIIIS